MALKTTTWRPYNCQCVIEYTSDPDLPNSPVTYSKHVQVCAAHQALADNSKRWLAAVDESTAQGAAMAAIAELFPDLTVLVTQDPTYLGNGRIIRLSIPLATPQQLAQIRAALAARGIASGKVIVG